ncbi:MAG: hypothetical protein HC819_10985 [Cyclobacteriaceae bacterium]|nr:hypothetical protein [Cyclobacteriaceae bacterium]
MERIKTFVSEHFWLIRFLGLAFLLLLTWVLFTTFFPGVLSQMHYYVIRPQADITAFFLEALGYDFEQRYLLHGCEAMIIFQKAMDTCALALRVADWSFLSYFSGLFYSCADD